MDKSIIYTQKKAAKKNRKKDSFYRSFLLTLFLFTAFFIVFTLIFLFAASINGFITQPELTLSYFLFGNEYNPAANLFAAGFMVINTLLVSLFAILIAVPISIFTAVFIARVLSKKFATFMFAIIAILAAIPSVVYGAFGAIVINNVVTGIFNVQAGTMLTVVLMLAFMIMPTVTLLSITAINSVDPKLEESAYALGATKTQTSLYVTLKAAKGGIIVGILLGIARALGEATAVSMVASQTNFGPTFNLLGNIRLLTATMMSQWGEGGAGSIERASSLAMCTLLFIVVIIVFSALKIFESYYSIESIERRNIKKINKETNLNLNIQKYGIDNISVSDQKKYLEGQLIKKYEKKKINQKSYTLTKGLDFSNTLTTKKIRNYKKKKEIKNNVMLGLFASIGFILLGAIIIFLMIGGLDALNWEYLTTRGKYIFTDSSGTSFTVDGLAIPLIGTLFTIVFSLLIAIPVGVLIAIYFSIYLQRTSKRAKVFSLIIQLLSSIPSIVYGIIGSIIFLQLLRLDDLHIVAFAGVFIMAIVLLPTIVKTTEQSLNDVNKGQKEGSYALGATKYKTSTKVLLKQVYPQIISAAVIATGIVLADSAIFFILYGTAFDGQDVGDWINNGGPTLALEMYSMARGGIVPWDQVKAIGLLIVFLIVILSISAGFVREKRFKEVLIIFIGFILFFVSVYFAWKVIFILSLIIIVFGMIIYPILIYINKKYHFINLRILME
ncbi:/ pstC / Phosphate transport system permease protein pstC /:407916 Reverse [Candidatus Hepatoplasma crinochetorum]|uniref:/ pstC / Phosphate transport system permease protein pstC /:407916 Reverse n=1 Tax=Candidatus Hepatoplasma crinochetorum TaxID=295596 RepID=A0A0G7ZMU0_9MOLU|nr:/ pstC / Phosphate transport system permease protein pstC /:407916 Reverse [Candidatus Hepatoplasma crinochetorum]